MRYTLAALAILLLTACETTPILPMQDHEDTRNLTPEERRLWHSAVELDEQMEKADYLYEDVALQVYLNNLMHKLYPEYTGSITVRIVDSDEEILSCFPVMRQLRPRYEADGFVAQVRRQQAQGYRLALLTDDEAVVAVAGYRIGENLAWGKYLYVDDLVTDNARRSSGYGAELMEWLRSVAREAGCDELHSEGLRKGG